ncbi:putative metalloprotease CJM1_0395 family protein [Bacillus tianshenii]|nr:putative metalloprotease CJM1_0395 family protein [Bacillus tianshenii]
MQISSGTSYSALHQPNYSKPQESHNNKIDQNHDQEKQQAINKEKSSSERQEKKNEEKPEVRAQIQQLKQNEQKVKAHEQAHMSAGGGLAGGVSFEYTQGPDGKKYIVGGEVPIQIAKGKTPEQTVQNMEQVKRAALAPANPSPQDHRVAAKASMLQMKAQQEAYKKDKESMEQYRLEKGISPNEQKQQANQEPPQEDITTNTNQVESLATSPLQQPNYERISIAV